MVILLGEVGIGHSANVPLLVPCQSVIEELAEVWLVGVASGSHGNQRRNHTTSCMGGVA